MGADAIQVVQDALIQALFISLPILGMGLLVGLLISLFQAVTQIQEQTLTFVPKIVVMILVSVALLGWIAAQLGDYAIRMFTGIGA